MIPETQPNPPLGEERHQATRTAERETTRRFYLFQLGLIVIVALIAITIMAFDDDGQNSNIAAVAVIAGTSTGALAVLAARDRK